MAIKNTKDICNGSQGEGNIFGNGNQGGGNILPTVGLHRACRETTMPSLSGSVSRLASEARRRFSMRTLSLQQRTALSRNQPGAAESLVLNGVSHPGVKGGKYCDDILPV